jgi:hypothetical protein
VNTPAHIILGAAVCAHPRYRTLILAGFAGGLAPDVSLHLLAGIRLFGVGISPQRVFNELYFSDAWQTVFAIDNSFFVWAGLLAAAILSGRDWARVLCLAALLHVLCDMPLHHDDGRPHFWPLTTWVYESPISYWDRAQGAMWVAPIEAALVAIGSVSLWLARPGGALTAAIALLLLAELWVVRQWLFVFFVT